jgi:hypothetical protein
MSLPRDPTLKRYTLKLFDVRANLEADGATCQLQAL